MILYHNVYSYTIHFLLICPQSYPSFFIKLLLNVCKDPVSTIGGAINLAPHLGSSPTAVVSGATALANPGSPLRRVTHNILNSVTRLLVS
jgi:hypothetical protein